MSPILESLCIGPTSLEADFRSPGASKPKMWAFGVRLSIREKKGMAFFLDGP
jgi:hypothetical protein